MNDYISLLRGINVGGKNIIKMAGLVNLYESLDFKNVNTYMQSGNIVFSTSIKSKSNLKSIIKKRIYDNFQLHVPLIILSESDLKKVIDHCPFVTSEFDKTKVYITFLERIPEQNLIDSLIKMSTNSEKFTIIKKIIYLFCSDGYGRTRFNNNFFESKLNVKATTRNWKTANRLLEMINDIKCKQRR